MPHIGLADKRSLLQVGPLLQRLPDLSVGRAEDLRNGPGALRPFAEDIFPTRRYVKPHATYSGGLLAPVVLLLHYQVKLLKTVKDASVFLLVVVQRLQQAYHRYAAFMFYQFHGMSVYFLSPLCLIAAFIKDMKRGLGLRTVD